MEAPLVEDDGRVYSAYPATPVSSTTAENEIFSPTADEAEYNRISVARRGRAGIASSTINLTNTIVGSGIIAMSYVCRSTGWLLFAMLLCLAAMISHFAVRCIFLAVVRTKLARGREYSYTSLGRKLFNNSMGNLSSWVVTLQQLGCCVAYVVIVGKVI